MNVNPEFARAVGYARSVRSLALATGVPYTTLLDQYKRGHMSVESAQAARKIYPDLSFEGLVTPLQKPAA